MPKSATPLTSAGRVFFAIAILGFGIQYALYGHLRRGLPLCPLWLHPNTILAYALAALCIAAGLALLTTWRTATVSLILGLVLLATSVLYAMHFNYVLYDGDGRTLFLECLSLAATALIIHGISSGSKYSLMPGRLLFAIAMIIFGIQHFLYVRFLSTLVPHYLPGHHLWVIGTGLALIAAGVSLATTIEDKYAAYGLFVLFFGWLVLLHAPRILHALHNADEWSSGFVVLAFSGTSLLLAASSSGATASKSSKQAPRKERPWRP
ncbi:MAG TPA: hypothetical protein VK814_14750 [Acidobacteriaceae bacterium]|jgi:hypothetical protein|nr:hypothetical protein [Acidobacteriaceae bacterium]